MVASTEGTRCGGGQRDVPDEPRDPDRFQHTERGEQPNQVDRWSAQREPDESQHRDRRGDADEGAPRHDTERGVEPEGTANGGHPAPLEAARRAGGRSPTWARRRGLSAREREGNEPWARLQEHLAIRYDLDLRSGRRWEHPEPLDVVNLPLLLRQASTVVDRELREVLRGGSTPLDPIAFDMLRRVREKPSAAVNLSQYTRLSPPRVSEVVTRLERRGLVEREVSHRDLRVRRVCVTESGADLLDELEERVTDLARYLLDDLGADQQDVLLRLIGVLAEAA